MKSKDRMIGYCGYNCYLCAARSQDIEVRKNWLTRGGNILVISIILQRMLPAKDARAKATKSLISNVKLAPAPERKVYRAVLSAMNFHAKR